MQRRSLPVQFLRFLSKAQRSFFKLGLSPAWARARASSRRTSSTAWLSCWRISDPECAAPKAGAGGRPPNRAPTCPNRHSGGQHRPSLPRRSTPRAGCLACGLGRSLGRSTASGPCWHQSINLINQGPEHTAHSHTDFVNPDGLNVFQDAMFEAILDHPLDRCVNVSPRNPKAQSHFLPGKFPCPMCQEHTESVAQTMLAHGPRNSLDHHATVCARAEKIHSGGMIKTRVFKWSCHTWRSFVHSPCTGLWNPTGEKPPPRSCRVLLEKT